TPRRSASSALFPYTTLFRSLTAHRKELEAITQALMEFEIISGEECLAVMRGEKIVRHNDDEDMKGPIGSAVPTAGRIRPREEPEDRKSTRLNSSHVKISYAV